MPENSLGAVEDAIAAGYAVEVDLQLTKDGGLVVIHDETLERTTKGTGRVADHTLDELRAIELIGADETLSSINDLLALVSGRAAIFLELKSAENPMARAAMAAATTRALAGYSGAAAAMTFDPRLLEMLRPALPNTPLGILAGGEHDELPPPERVSRNNLLHTEDTEPDFVGYDADELPSAVVTRQRRRRKILTWTVRSQEQADRLADQVDQIIFEGFLA